MKQQKKPVFKSQKEYLRYLRRKRHVTRILAVCSVVLLFVYILAVNPHSIVAWIVFVFYILSMVILNYYAEQEYLKEDTIVANKKTQQRLAGENKKRIGKQHYR